MQVAKRIDRLPPWFAVFLGLWLCGLPAMRITLAAEFTPPSRGTPGQREGGGTHDNCVLGNPSLTALSPQASLGLTTAAYPRFFWFVPKTRAQVGVYPV